MLRCLIAILLTFTLRNARVRASLLAISLDEGADSQLQDQARDLRHRGRRDGEEHVRFATRFAQSMASARRRRQGHRDDAIDADRDAQQAEAANGDTLLFDSQNLDKSTPELREQMKKYIGSTLAIVRVDGHGRVHEVKQGSRREL